MLILEISSLSNILFIALVGLFSVLLFLEVFEKNRKVHIVCEEFYTEKDMTKKEEAAERLLKEYRDPYGRVTLHPAAKSDPRNGRYDSENQNLWTGESSVLLQLNGLSSEEHDKLSDQGFAADTIEPGLISRHPYPHWENPNHHKVSWDEYNGLMYHCITTGNQDIPKEVLDYGRRHLWIYLDGEFGMENRTFRDKLKLYLGALRQPRDIFFFKIAAGIKPNLFETLWACTSHILTARKPAGVTSGKVMAWHKAKAIEIAGYDGFFWNLAHKYFDKKLKKCYNQDNYMESVIGIYFSDDHPFQELIKGL